MSRPIIKKILEKAEFERKKPEMINTDKMARLKTVSDAVLWGLFITANYPLIITFPDIFNGIAKFLLVRDSSKNFSAGQTKQKLYRTFYYLRSKGYIRMKLTKDDIFVYLTKKAKRKMKKINLDILEVQAPKRWKEKWWLIAADIPTKKHKRSADLFRIKIREMQFYPLQRTLWLYPHDPREEINFLAKYYGIEKFVTAMEISRLDREDERVLKNFFRESGIIKINN